MWQAMRKSKEYRELKNNLERSKKYQKNTALQLAQEKANKERMMTDALVSTAKTSGSTGKKKSGKRTNPPVEVQEPSDEEESDEEAHEETFIIKDFVWETGMEKKGLFEIKWHSGQIEYSAIKPVLIDREEEAMKFVWDKYYPGRTNEIGAIEEAASKKHNKKTVVKDFKSLKHYGEQRKWVVNEKNKNGDIQGAQCLRTTKKKKGRGNDATMLNSDAIDRAIKEQPLPLVLEDPPIVHNEFSVMIEDMRKESDGKVAQAEVAPSTPVNKRIRPAFDLLETPSEPCSLTSH